MKGRFFEEDGRRNALLAQTYGQMPLRQDRRNIPCLEGYRLDVNTGNYVCHNHNWGWSTGLGALSQNVIRYSDRAQGRATTEGSAHTVSAGQVEVSVWRPDNQLSMVELTSRALADVKAGNIVVMSDDMEASKLERVAKCLKAGVRCFIMDMGVEKIERILRAIKLDVVLFLDEGMRLDSIKCQGIVRECHHQIFDSSEECDYTEEQALEDLFAGISLQDLAEKSAETIIHAGSKRSCSWDDEVSHITRPRIGV